MVNVLVGDSNLKQSHYEKDLSYTHNTDLLNIETVKSRMNFSVDFFEVNKYHLLFEPKISYSMVYNLVCSNIYNLESIGYFIHKNAREVRTIALDYCAATSDNLLWMLPKDVLRIDWTKVKYQIYNIVRWGNFSSYEDVRIFLSNLGVERSVKEIGHDAGSAAEKSREPKIMSLRAQAKVNRKFLNIIKSFTDGKTYSQIANEYGLKTQTIKHTVSKYYAHNEISAEIAYNEYLQDGNLALENIAKIDNSTPRDINRRVYLYCLENDLISKDFVDLETDMPFEIKYSHLHDIAENMNFKSHEDIQKWLNDVIRIRPRTPDNYGLAFYQIM